MRRDIEPGEDQERQREEDIAGPSRPFNEAFHVEDEGGSDSSDDPPFTEASQDGGFGDVNDMDDDSYDSPPEAPRWETIGDPHDYYKLVARETKRVKRFNSQGDIYSVRFRNIKPINGIRSVINTLGNVFQSLLDRLFSEFDAMDFVSVSIRLPGLEDPFWLPFARRGLFTVNDLLRRLEAILQSNTNVSLDGNATITVTRVVMDRGGSGRRLDRGTMNLEKWLLRKKCVVMINNKDDLCCARAIVTARAKEDQHVQYDTIKRGRIEQTQLAISLHRQAGVPEGPCGLEELSKFQDVLSNEGYQLIVLSASLLNGMWFKGKEAPHKLYLYFYDNHYATITSMKGFVCRSYFCEICFKGYSNKQDHKCENKCHCCFKTYPDCPFVKWVHCNDCNRYFMSSECSSMTPELIFTFLTNTDTF